VTSKWTAGRNWSQRLERIVFVDLLVTAMGATLAFGTVEPWSLALFQLNALVVGGILVVLAAFDPAFAWSRQWLALPLWGWLLWAICQTLPLTGEVGAIGAPPPEALSMEQLRLATISEAPHLTRAAAFKLFAFSLYFSAALQVLRTSSRRRLTVQVLAGFGLMVACLAILQRLTSPRTLYWIRPVSDYVAPFGPFANYNHFAGFVELLFPLPLASLLFREQRGDSRLLFRLSTLVLLVAGILSISRGGLLSMGGQLLLFGILLMRQTGRRRTGRSRGSRGWTLLIGAGVVVALSWWIGSQSLLSRLATFEQGARDYSVVTRLAYWKAAWRILLDHPLTGVGVGAFPSVYPRYGSSSAQLERVEEVHNDYLHLLVETGLIGGGLLLAFLVLGVRSWRAQVKKMATAGRGDPSIFFGSSIALVGLALHSWVDFNLQIPSNALLFLLMTAMIAPAEEDLS
jgi:O-antigen ligase